MSFPGLISHAFEKENTTGRDPFWVVWSPQGGNPITKHATRPEAIAEAERLTLKHPGREFFVLVAVARTAVKMVETEYLGQWAKPERPGEDQSLAVSCFIVDRLEEDLMDRRGLKHEWGAIAPEVRDEIRKTWADICRSAIKSGLNAAVMPSA